MTTHNARIEPTYVVEAVEAFVYKELSDADNYDNRQPLDESGVFSLHRVAAAIYELGYIDGENAESRRVSSSRLRKKEQS